MIYVDIPKKEQNKSLEVASSILQKTSHLQDDFSPMVQLGQTTVYHAGRCIFVVWSCFAFPPLPTRYLQMCEPVIIYFHLQH